MWFEPCSIKETKARKTNDVRGLLMKIISSGEACVEIKDHGYKTLEGCSNALRVAIKRDRLKQLKVTTNNKRIFVINTLMVKEVN